MGTDTTPLRRVLALLEPQADATIGRFYERLFAARPAFQAHFANTDWTRQRRMLLSALVLALECEEEPGTVAATLRAFGRRHDAFGYGADDFVLFGETLRQTLAEAAGAAWTPEVDQVWHCVYPNAVLRMHGRRPGLSK